ncbi:MAG: metallophosphoesterase [Elusimicrobiales bacterium]
MKNPFHFFGLGLALFNLLFNAYLAWWAGRRLAGGPWGRFAAVMGALLLSAFYPAARVLAGLGHSPFLDGLLWAAYFCFGASFILFWSLAACDLLLALLSLAGLKAARGRPAAWACSALACGLVALAAVHGSEHPRVRRVEVPLPGLPAALDGLTILQVSDLHVGRMIRNGRVAHIAETSAALRPDLLVFTGDFAESREPMPAGVCEALAGMTAVRAKAAVLGNHDMFTGGGPAAKFFSDCGIRPLRGEVWEPVPGLQLAGVDDLRRGDGAGADRLAPRLDRSKPLVFLSHQPQGFDAVTAEGYGLVLAGHTHNGQIFPFGPLEERMFKYFHGLYKAGGFYVYVTSGAGTWGPPLRLFARSELPLFTLRAAGPPAGRGR